MSARRTKPLGPVRPEAEVLKSVLRMLKAHGIDAARQNTGGFLNPAGRYVACGRRGNSDISGMIPAGWGPASGRKIDIEVKRSDFDPEKLRGKKREHFDRQLARLKLTNANGGYGVWVTDAGQVLAVLDGICGGRQITFDGDYPYLTMRNEP